MDGAHRADAPLFHAADGSGVGPAAIEGGPAARGAEITLFVDGLGETPAASRVQATVGGLPAVATGELPAVWTTPERNPAHAHDSVHSRCLPIR